jgi:hypothetical protein
MNSINAEEASLSNASIGPKPLHRTTVARRAQGKIVSRAAYRESMSLLSTQQQLTLVNEINRLTDIGLPPTPAMVANFAADICKKKPGKNWVYEFTKKYEKNLKSAYLTAAHLSRKKADNKGQYGAYFKLVCILLRHRLHTKFKKVEQKIEKYNILPQNTYNMDEKGFLIGVLPKARRIFTKSGQEKGKLLGAGQDGNREWMSRLRRRTIGPGATR